MRILMTMYIKQLKITGMKIHTHPFLKFDFSSLFDYYQSMRLHDY